LLYPLAKTLNAVSHLGAKQSTRCGGPAQRKTCKQNRFCVRVVWQIQSTVQHLDLVQTKKKNIKQGGCCEYQLFKYSTRKSNPTLPTFSR